ncbi:hypothetical protein [Lichenibacterium ramalinae]|uniref:Uncharacterized protein n=1 Tax=Lichenibacterium ramalinae TaxID=2316527 RepID=A0A4Q2RHD3_9HYPH|nr:hypothetical protein [Lichenibacterium ramalinae]RYB06122.1 hypothetical protein D3272_08035 [Lichenibacterium ramalinae]
MRAITKPALLLLGLAAGVPAASGAFAQTPPAAAAPQAPAAAPQSPAAAAAGNAADVKQIPLTPALVDQFIAAKKDVDAALDAMPEGVDQPDPATLAKLDAVAKKYKFDDYKQYDATETNIGIVMAGIDPATKQYIGPEAVIKKQIGEVQADKQIPAKDKKDTVDQLTAALATIPKLQYPDNVAVVTKNFDRLNEAMPQD